MFTFWWLTHLKSNFFLILNEFWDNCLLGNFFLKISSYSFLKLTFSCHLGAFLERCVKMCDLKSTLVFVKYDVKIVINTYNLKALRLFGSKMFYKKISKIVFFSFKIRVKFFFKSYHSFLEFWLRRVIFSCFFLVIYKVNRSMSLD